MSILKTINWFLRRPKYYPQIFQILSRKKNRDMEDTRREASEWCKKICITKKKACEIISDGKINFTEVNFLFPEVIKRAKQREKECSYKMGGEGAISFLYCITKHINAERIIETGVAYGWSSLAILLAIKENGKAKLISNDMPYVNMNNEEVIGCVIPKNIKDKWELQMYPDVVGIPKALKKFKGEIDLCHYDSDKSYTGRMFAYPLLWDALENEGIMISDDVQDNLAFHHFSQEVNRSPLVIKHLGKYVGIIKK